MDLLAVSTPIEDDTNLDPLEPNGVEKRGRKRKSPNETKVKSDFPFHEDLKVNIDAPIFKGDVMLVGFETFIRTREARLQLPTVIHCLILLMKKHYRTSSNYCYII